MLALYVAALGHDVGHFGRTNAYLANSKHALHLLYPTSTLERFHADRVSKLLADPDDGLAPCVPEIADLARDPAALRRASLVLATDMAKHKSIASDFEVLVGDRARRANRGGDEATTRGVSDSGPDHVRLDDDERELALRAANEVRRLIVHVVLHASRQLLGAPNHDGESATGRARAARAVCPRRHPRVRATRRRDTPSPGALSGARRAAVLEDVLRAHHSSFPRRDAWHRGDESSRVAPRTRRIHDGARASTSAFATRDTRC